MKYQIQFSGKNKKIIVDLSSAEFALSVLSVIIWIIKKYKMNKYT